MARSPIQKGVGRLLKYGTLISTYALIASVLLQIIARFFFTQSPAWTEEASRLFFIYAMAFAAGLALEGQYYVFLDVFQNRLSNHWNRRLQYLVSIVSIVLFGVISVYAVIFMIQGIPERSPSMPISMSIAFASIWVLSASICYYAIIQFRGILKS